ncbi:MAG: hypothetical protein KDB23_21590, partial [Planctomycetales bacterium]|nr:hypothetical protein [Planctomycetales bacterium]
VDATSTDQDKGDSDTFHAHPDGGDHFVVGGYGGDHIELFAPNTVITGDNVVLGDNGRLEFDTNEVLQVATTEGFDDLADAGDTITITSTGDQVVIAGPAIDNVTTSAGNDTILGDWGRIEWLNGTFVQIRSTDLGLGDDDTLDGGTGDDVIFGGFGLDTIYGRAGRDTLLGDHGQLDFDNLGNFATLKTLDTDNTSGTGDVIYGGADDNTILGGIGRDTITAGMHNDVILGDNGQLTYLNGILQQILSTDQGLGDIDTIDAGDGANWIVGGAENDNITALGGGDVIFGDNADIRFTTTGQRDIMLSIDPAVAGNDTIAGGDGQNIVIGGSGSDTIYGLLAGTTPQGGAGAEVLVGDNAQVQFDPASGLPVTVRSNHTSTGDVDTIHGGDGVDYLIGGIGADVLRGDAGDDVIVGDNAVATYADRTQATSPNCDEVLSDGFNGTLGDFAHGLLVNVWTCDATIVDSYDDQLFGGDDADVIVGGNGTDTIDGGADAGADTVLGDNGYVEFNAAKLVTQIGTLDWTLGARDIIVLGDGRNVVVGGTGNDDITTGDDDDILIGDHGVVTFDDEQVVVDVTSEQIVLGDNDDLFSGDGSDVVFGGFGSDYINILRSNDTLVGTDVGMDYVVGDNGHATFDNVAGVSVIRLIETTDSTVGDDDHIWTNGGSDIVFGGFGADEIIGGAGSDRIFGDSGLANFSGDGVLTDATSTNTADGGNDEVFGGPDRDIIFGGAGDDVLHGQADRDIIFGDNGRLDYLVDDNPTSLDLVITINPLDGGADTITGDADDDYIIGGTAGDTINGDAGHDIILGDHGSVDWSLPLNHNFRSIFTGNDQNAGNDVIHGDAGDDFILGQQGDDQLFGDDNEDDIIGGHNVVGGQDGNDTIDGGNHADVILGDNGTIVRELFNNADNDWVRYPAPFADVVREVVRFDDIDQISGDDTILGQDGDDIIHGQRGNDTISGGTGDDELIGELGNDVLNGDDGNDTLLGDVGRIVRDYNDNGTPRVNENGSWHRDIFLEEVGTVIGSINLDATPLATLDPALAAKLFTADLIVATGAFDANGQKVIAGNGAWDTELLLIKLTTANDDQVNGGAGDDVMIGQRGNDTLRGAAQKDFIVGDSATNYMAYKTELPHIANGIRLIGMEPGSNAPLQLAVGGSVILTPETILPEEIERNQPFTSTAFYGNLTSQLVTRLIEDAGAGSLQRNDGSYLTPYVAAITDVINHTNALPGNDTIFGGADDDLIIADNAYLQSPLVTGLDAIDAAR